MQIEGKKDVGVLNQVDPKVWFRVYFFCFGLSHSSIKYQEFHPMYLNICIRARCSFDQKLRLHKDLEFQVLLARICRQST